LDRRRFLGAAAVMGGAGALGLGGCATARSNAAPAVGPGMAWYDAMPTLAPVRPHPDRIFRITVCLRPFRAQGPRLDTEMVGDKLVVHNYGHGGSGWSLSWGSGEIAVGKAMARGEKDIAVIGCGALGLTAAVVAQRAGARVTIYAKDLMPQVRSARATGAWSPDSRIALDSAVSPQFPALWEQMTRTSFLRWQTFLGMPGDPVEWNDRYNLSDLPPELQRAKRRADNTMGFAEYSSERVPDLTPKSILMPRGSHPFASAYVTRNSGMMFSVAEYGHLLMSDFLQAGGKIEVVEFHSPADYMALPQKVIINCPGYGARALWKDETIIPVRGQIAWLIPQPEVTYGLSYKNVTMLSRHDGIVIQQTNGTDAWGYNDANETPDRAEAETALASIAEVYDDMRPLHR
jgi:glycine/D-amino acid oxidase-like deaminating enzyme